MQPLSSFLFLHIHTRILIYVGWGLFPMQLTDSHFKYVPVGSQSRKKLSAKQNIGTMHQWEWAFKVPENILPGVYYRLLSLNSPRHHLYTILSNYGFFIYILVDYINRVMFFKVKTLYNQSHSNVLWVNDGNINVRNCITSDQSLHLNVPQI